MAISVLMKKKKGLRFLEFRDLKKQYQELHTEIDHAINELITSGHFIGGEVVSELEKHLAEYVGVRNCITCANGTDALVLALMSWGIGHGDAVFVPDFSFFATAEAPAFLEATPVFVDVDKQTYNMAPGDLENQIKSILEKGELVPRAVITVDLFGLPADYDRIRPICEKYGLYLLEDGAQGFGGEIRGKRACSFGDISTTSFFPAKPLGCYGDGGAVFTDNNEWAERIRSLAVHGKSSQSKYDNIRIGMNSRLDSIQAAILLVKSEAFENHELDDVNKIARWYQEELYGMEIAPPFVPEGFRSSWAQYTVKLPQKTDRKDLQRILKEEGIPTMVYYVKPLHLQKAFACKAQYTGVVCRVTEVICNRVLSFPMHPYMDRETVKYVVEMIRRNIGNGSR